MTASVIRDNKNEERVASRKQPEQQVSDILIPSDASVEAELEVDRKYQELPAVQGAQGSNINFLGSSYSGSDIKVVAHLYDQDQWVDDKIEATKSKLSIAQNIIDLCSTLLQTGFLNLSTEVASGSSLDYGTQRDAFIAAATSGNGGRFTNEEGQQAIAIVVANVFQQGSFTFLGIAKMRRRAEYLKTSNEAIKSEVNARLENLETLDKEKNTSSSTVVLATLQTLSVQSFREKNAVRALGHSYAKGYTRGARTIGGSMIFTIFNEHALTQLIRSMSTSVNYGGERDTELATLLPDQLPPIDLTIVFANEYGSLSDFRLYGVEFVTDGSVYSIEDLLSEQTMNFVCRDADVMTSRGKVRISRLQRGMFNDKDDKDQTGSSLLFGNDSYVEYLDKLRVRRRLTNR